MLRNIGVGNYLKEKYDLVEYTAISGKYFKDIFSKGRIN